MQKYEWVFRNCKQNLWVGAKESSTKKKLDELDAQIKALKDETALYMKKRQKNELEVDVYKVLYTPYEKPQFDSKAFKANEDNGEELYKKYCKVLQMQKVTVRLATI